MKKIPKTIQVDAYMEDDGNPVCGQCTYRLPWKCVFRNFTTIPLNYPGPDCPVWKRDDTGAEDNQP